MDEHIVGFKVVLRNKSKNLLYTLIITTECGLTVKCNIFYKHGYGYQLNPWSEKKKGKWINNFSFSPKFEKTILDRFDRWQEQHKENFDKSMGPLPSSPIKKPEVKTIRPQKMLAI